MQSHSCAPGITANTRFGEITKNHDRGYHRTLKVAFLANYVLHISVDRRADVLRIEQIEVVAAPVLIARHEFGSLVVALIKFTLLYYDNLLTVASERAYY